MKTDKKNCKFTFKKKTIQMKKAENYKLKK